MGSLFDAPADAVALQQLAEATLAHPARFRLRHLFGARALGQSSGYWFEHVGAVRVVARQLAQLTADGYQVIPHLRVPGTQDELLDFLVISPRGSVYALVVHNFGPKQVRVNREALLAAGRAYAYPPDLRAKADEVSLRLQQRQYPHKEVIPMLVAVNTSWLSARNAGRVKAATDYTLVRKIRKREERRMRQGFDVLPLQTDIATPDFWQDQRTFDPVAHADAVRTYRRCRVLNMIANGAAVFWSQVAFGLLAGGLLGVAYYLSTMANSAPMIILPGG